MSSSDITNLTNVIYLLLGASIGFLIFSLFIFARPNGARVWALLVKAFASLFALLVSVVLRPFKFKPRKKG